MRVPRIRSSTPPAVTKRAKAPIYQAIKRLQRASMLEALPESRRNQAWEATELLALLGTLEAGNNRIR